MTADDPPTDPADRKGAAKTTDRQERLARALRENLRRRKDQDRARTADPPPAAAGPSKVD